jgi:hypothetical protein
MRITVQGGVDMARALEEWRLPAACEELVIDAPNARRFTNCLLNSPIDCRVEITPTNLPEVSYAGLFSLCRALNNQPKIDMRNCVSMAAMFKQNESMRYSLYGLKETANVRDMRQCFLGCTFFSGNGLQEWDFTGLASPNSMTFFATRTTFFTRYYDGLIENLYEQAKTGLLPTPMNRVDFGNAKFSPHVADKREYVIRYGWEIMDGGQVPYELSPLEKAFIASVDDRLEANEFPGTIDLGPICRSARGGILISPRHVLYVKHYQPAAGQAISLWSGETAIVERSTAGGWDIAVATLRDPVSTQPALVFPANWKTLMPSMAGPPSQYPDGARPPLLWANRLNEIGLWDLSYADDYPPQAQSIKPIDPLREQWFRGIFVGDSGSPVCCVYGDRLVVAFPLAMSSGSGVFTGSVREWLDEVTQGMVEEVVAA